MARVFFSLPSSVLSCPTYDVGTGRGVCECEGGCSEIVKTGFTNRPDRTVKNLRVIPLRHLNVELKNSVHSGSNFNWRTRYRPRPVASFHVSQCVRGVQGSTTYPRPSRWSCDICTGQCT